MSETAEAVVAEPAAEPAAAETPAAAPAPDAPDPRRAENRRLIEAAKRERKLQEESQKLKAERDAYAKDKESSKSEREQIARWRAAQENAKRKPLDYVKEAGLTLEDLVKAQLADGEPSHDLLIKDVSDRTSAETKAIRDELEKIRKEREDERVAAQHEEAKRATAEINHDIARVLKSDPDKYEYIAALGQEHEVFEVMRLAYVEKKRILSAEEAADLLETHLEGLAGKVSKTKKMTRLQSPQDPATPATPKVAPQAKTVSGARAEASTLTNNIVTSPASPDEGEPLLPKEEALARIKLKVTAKLKEQQAAKAAVRR